MKIFSSPSLFISLATALLVVVFLRFLHPATYSEIVYLSLAGLTVLSGLLLLLQNKSRL